MINDASALADQTLTYAMQGLQIELICRVHGDELHRGPLHGLGDCLGIAKVVLLSLRVGPYILGRHQQRIVAEATKLAAKMMRTNASFHADQARRHIGQPRLDLTSRPLLTQHNSAAIVLTNDVE